jgi:aspartyl-tRNA(Asn)/glutamyl-tRNA(Gln) amidotransferase subunit A
VTVRSPTDLAFLSLEEVVRELRERRASAEEVVRASLERIERLEPRLHAFITVSAERALAEARVVPPAAPFAGAPIALKDIFDTAGVRTTAGSRIFADRVPEEDAPVVARLRAAGAVSVGKTNTHEWAFGVTTQNPHFGGTRNPWDLARIPGGSSGGSAVALAAGLCYGALGSDTGGSIRIPASLCGVVGLKPTFGRVSTRGVVPLSWNLDHVGPMARTVRDVALLYAAIAGHDPLDPGSVDVPVEDPLARIEDGVRGMRVGVPSGHFFERSDAEVAALVRDAIAVLEREGASVEECAFPPSQLLIDTQRTILSTDAAAYHRERMQLHAMEIGEDVRTRLRAGEGFSGADYAIARRHRDEIRHQILALFARYDVLAMPATPIAAPLAEGTDAVAEAARLTATTSPFNLAGLPAIAVPCGYTAAGLPVGLQITSGPWREATVLRAARAYERATDRAARRPAIAISA